MPPLRAPLLLVLAICLLLGPIPSAAADTRLPVGPVADSSRSSGQAQEGIDLAVATFNVMRTMPSTRQRKDQRRLLRDRSLDVIAWQESDGVAGHLDRRARQRGRRTIWSPRRAIALSYRTERLKLLRTRTITVHGGCGSQCGRMPFGPRYIIRALFRVRGSGVTVAVNATHVNSDIEDHWSGRNGRPARNLNARLARSKHFPRLAKVARGGPGRFAADHTLTLGDLNVDRVADLRHRVRGFPARTLDPVAASTYELVGTAGMRPTHDYTRRFVDYVYLARRDLAGTAVLSHTVLGGFWSDHDPLVARLDLR